jgi:hypothetical protein
MLISIFIAGNVSSAILMPPCAWGIGQFSVNQAVAQWFAG